MEGFRQELNLRLEELREIVEIFLETFYSVKWILFTNEFYLDRVLNLRFMEIKIIKVNYKASHDFKNKGSSKKLYLWIKKILREIYEDYLLSHFFEINSLQI